MTKSGSSRSAPLADRLAHTDAVVTADDTDHTNTSERVYSRPDLREWMKQMLHSPARK